MSLGDKFIKAKNMRKIFSLTLAIVLVILSGCQDPDELLPSVSRAGVNSISATFEDGSGGFIGYISEDSNEIVIPIPYYFPESSNNQVTVEQMSRMRVKANLDDNVIVSPSLLYMDLNKENTITVIDQRKQVKEYVVRGEIRKSSAGFIEEFKLPDLGLTGVINENTNSISLVSLDNLEPSLASIKISAHSTISPDPTVEVLDYNKELTFTVTAHDGITKTVYTLNKVIPERIPYGIRPGSAKLLFAKKLKADLGITVDNLTGGIAATKDYVVLNTRNANSVYINAKSGEKMGEIDLGPVKGSLSNFYNTADDNGNILVNNLAPNNGSFKIWKLSSVGASPDLYIEWDGGEAVGRKVSVMGSLDENAIITAPILSSGQRFARWTVVGGVLQSQTPEIVQMSGLPKGWTTNVDIVQTSKTDVTADYFVASYSDNSFAWVNGQTNNADLLLDPISTNYIPNAVDYIEFNNAKYTVTNWVNSFTWGAADGVWLLDVSNNADFSGNLDSGTCNAVVWEAEKNVYGAKGVSPVVANANGTGDVALTVSEDGYFMYLYFMFTNGYVVGYQFDAIDM